MHASKFSNPNELMFAIVRYEIVNVIQSVPEKRPKSRQIAWLRQRRIADPARWSCPASLRDLLSIYKVSCTI